MAVRNIHSKISHDLQKENMVFYGNECNDALKMARNFLRCNFENVLNKLDYDEWISLIFLLFDEANAHVQGFRNMSLLFSERDSRKKEVVSSIHRALMESGRDFDCVFDPLIEAFYHLGRYDILEDDLGLCWDHSLHTVCKNLHCVLPENLALYHVFSGLAQDDVDRLMSRRLTNWHSHKPGEMFEVKFLRNFDRKRNSYMSLIIDLHTALVEENFLPLARFLEPFIWEKEYSDRMTPQHNPSELDVSEFYPLPQGEPHGLCVIINVREFQEFEGSRENFPRRIGSDVDRDLLAGTFKLLGFVVVHLDDPDYATFQSFFKKLRMNSKMHAMGALAVCVMTHGDKEDNLYLTDGHHVGVNELRHLCYARALIGKPKMFFIQACRGDATLNPMFLQRDGTIISNVEADCIISEATVQNYSAMRSQSSGSWYINDLCSSLQEIGHLRPLKTVLNLTRTKLSKRVEVFHNRYVTQISEDKVTLRKEIQLQRGEDLFAEGIVDLTLIKVFDDLLQYFVSIAVDREEEEEELEGGGGRPFFDVSFGPVA